MRFFSRTPKSNIFHTDRFTRGGQIFSHEWRMRMQNMRVVALLSLLFAFIGLFLSNFIFDLSWWLIWEFYICSYLLGYIKVLFWPVTKDILYFFDQVLTIIMPGSKGAPSAYKTVWQLTTDFSTPDGKQYVMRTVEFLNHPWTLNKLMPLHKSFWIILGAWSVGMGILIWLFKHKSKKIEEEKILKGRHLETPSKLAKKIRKAGVPDFEISPGIPLPKNSENQHTIVVGATRMGKTNCILGMLKQIRENGQRAIILDATGEFTSRFYRPGRDKIFNPLDKRSVSWDIWQEHLASYEYDTWAATMIPDGHGDPIWHGNARKLLAITAIRLASQPKKSMNDILRWCCTEPLGSQTIEFYAETLAASFMTPVAEKTAAGIRLQVNNVISAFEFLTSAGSISICDWVANRKKTDEWIFLTALPTQRKTLAPLLSSWFSFAFAGLERAGQDFDHRLWMVADELGGLDFPISSLKRIVTEGAKYGACCLLGFQNVGQLDDLYGHNVRATLLSNCSTKVIFRTNDQKSAHDLSLALGDQDIMSPNENFSLGANSIRDGVTIASHQRSRPVISATDIMSLEQLNAYLLLSGNFPTVKAKYDLNILPETQPSFVKKELLNA
jgi:type IV conjugative transfer system coupling protein TraD